MKKSRYTEEQIAFALKQAEMGTPVAEFTRRMGVSEQTFYRWKKVYGGLGVAELRRVKQLEDENRKMQAGNSHLARMSNRGTVKLGGPSGCVPPPHRMVESQR
jgi:putative transposase